MATKPDYNFEKRYWARGFDVVGIDEVGKGAVAGPVVSGAVMLSNREDNVRNILSLGIDDSKRLTRKKREELEPVIKKYFYWGVGEVTSAVINRKGIVYATRLAMKRAIKNLMLSMKGMVFKDKVIFLIDGRTVEGIGRQVAIVKGDQKSISIAAASIIAKVYRDKLMRDLSGKYIGYGFDQHVGYGTKKHAMKIIELGMCEIHRVEFVQSLIKVR